MMEVQKIFIDGFKNLSNININFDKLTALVALNNFGKSNVLSALEFAISFIQRRPIDKVKLMSSTKFIPLNKAIDNKSFTFAIELLMNLNSQNYYVYYEFKFNWALPNPKIIYESLKIKTDKKGNKFTQLINRTEEEAKYKSSKTGKCSTKIKIESNELVINKLQAYDNIYYLEVIKGINSLTFHTEKTLDAKNSLYVQEIVINKTQNEISVESLPSIIFELRNRYPNKYELLINTYKELFPNIEDLQVIEFSLNATDINDIQNKNIISPKAYFLTVKDKNLIDYVNFSSMSDGAIRIFTILTKIIIASIGNISLIAIEEPENSMHPKLFKAYIQIILQLLDQCKLIITSHSPYIINFIDPKWIYVGLNKKEGVAEFFSFKKTGRKKLLKDAEDLDMGMGDYLFSLISDNSSNIDEYLER